MSDPKTTTVDVNGFPCRVWTKGQGPKLGFLAGLGGLPRWLPFLDRLAETHTVIAPSLPGYPGATGHTELDTHLDWVLAVRQLVDKAGLAGADLVDDGADVDPRHAPGDEVERHRDVSPAQGAGGRRLGGLVHFAVGWEPG